MIQSDLKILDELLALNLNISLWSARKKLSAEDMGIIDLPPEDLATLGSKRVADPEKLKIFSTLKSRAFNFLDRHGVRFMSGWALPEAKAGLIIDELVKLPAEFFKAKDDFLAIYDQSIANWLAKHNEWANIIRDSIVSPDYVRSRLDFRWQLYKVEALKSHAQKNAVSYAGLAEEVTGLANTLFGEVARAATEIWRKVYRGKTEVTHKALSPLRTLKEKLEGLSFIEPHIAPVVEIIAASLNRAPDKGNITGTDLLMLQGLVNLLRDSENLVLYAQKLIDGYGHKTILDSLIASAAHGYTSAPKIEEASRIISDSDQEDEGPEAPAKAPQLISYGLW